MDEAWELATAQAIAENLKRKWLSGMTWDMTGNCHFGRFPEGRQQGPYFVTTHDFIVFEVVCLVCFLFDSTDWDDDVVANGLSWWQTRDWLAGKGNR